MIHLKTEIPVKKSAGEIYHFLLNLDEQTYCNWHPCHKEFRLVKRTEGDIGSIFFFKEIIEDVKVSYKWRLIECIDNRLFKMKALYFYPVFLEVRLEAVNDNVTIVHHSIMLGYDKKLLSSCMDWLIGRTIFSKRIRLIQQKHAHEEFTNLENIL